MKITCIRSQSLLPFWFFALVGLTLHLKAGFSNPALGIEAVPLGAESAEKDALDFARAAGRPYPTIEAPVPPADLSRLRDFPEFSQMTNDADRQKKMVGLRIMVLCAIDALKNEDPAAAACLGRLYANGLICVAKNNSRYVAAAIANDTSPECGNEPLNLYSYPCGEVPLHDPAFFRLANSLAHEALHAVQSHAQSRNFGDPNERARYLLVRHCNEVDASAAELRRARALASALNSINASGRLPDGVGGLAARIGASILLDPALTPARRSKVIADLLAAANEVIDDATATLECRQAYKRALELFLKQGTNRVGTYNSSIQETGWYRETTIRNLPEFGSYQITYRAGGGKFEDGPAGPVSVFRPNTEFSQISTRSPAEIIPLPARAISDCIRLAGTRKLLLAGTDPMGAGVVWSLEDGNDDGYYDRDSLKELLRDVEIAGGLRWVWNQSDSTLLGVNRRTDNIFQFPIDPLTGLPDRLLPMGNFDQRGDLHEFWTDSMGTLYGAAQLGGPIGGFDIFATAQRVKPGGAYVPTVPLSPLEKSIFRPSLSQVLFPGAEFINVRGTPNHYISATVKNPDGTSGVTGGKTDELGHLSLQLTVPLKPLGKVNLVDTNANMASVEEVAEPVKKTIELGINAGFSDKQKLGLNIDYQPFQKLDVDYSEDLHEWEDFGSYDLGGFGEKSLALDQPAIVAGFFRAAPVPPAVLKASPDTYVTGPGLTLRANVLENDSTSPGTRVILDGAPDIHPDLFTWTGDGNFTLSAPITGPTTIRFKYYLKKDDGTRSDSVTVTINVTFNELSRLISLTGADGKGHYNVPCIYLPSPSALGNKLLLRPFPIYQFRLANAPGDDCLEPHWHAHHPVFSITALLEGFLGAPIFPQVDPNPPSCGFGKFAEVPRGLITVPVEYWNTFIKARPPSP